MALTRSDVEALARDPALSLDRIDAACTARDYDSAFALAIAHLVAKRELPMAQVVRILEGDPEPYLVLHIAGKATGDRAALLDMLDRGRVPFEDTVVAILFVVWRTAGESRDAIRARTIRHLRRNLVEFDDEVSVLAAILVEEIADPILTGAADIFDLERDKAIEKHIANAITEPVSKLLAALPIEAPAKNVGFTVRAAQKPGRNDLCSCGSGKKYKKCCADKPAVDVASPLAGMTWASYLRDGAARMTDDDIANLDLCDLVQVDYGKLESLPLKRAFERFLRVRDWESTLRVLDVMHARDPKSGIGHTIHLLHEALAAGDREISRTIRARIPDDEPGFDFVKLMYDLCEDPATALDRIEQAARLALASDKPNALYDVAFAILRSYPALGVLVGRDLVSGEYVLDSETMVIEIERARALLDLPVDARIDERWETIVDKYRAAQAKPMRGSQRRSKRGNPEDESERKARALQSSLVAENERATRLERELAAAREALASASKPTTMTPASNTNAAPTADALRSMRDRVQSLEGKIREGNEERAELRRKLETTPKSAAPSKPAASAAPAVEEDPGDPVEARGRRVMVPVWKPDAVRSVESLPASVAALAIRTASELAVADDGAWHQVKQARDMSSPIYMARVGIHHRMIFELREGRLEIVDVITRETLLHVLKRIRSR